MASTEKEWEFGDFDDDSIRIVGEAQLRKYANFMDEYTTQLHDIEEALSDSFVETWDITLDPIGLQCAPYEQSSLLELIHTDNKIFNKVVTVLSALCSEMDMLKYEAEKRFYPALLFYGEGAQINGDSDGDAQILMGRMMATLQDLYSFIIRSYEVIRNTIQQMSVLHNPNRKLAGLDVTNIHFQQVFEHLADLLKVLLSLDEIISDHTMLKEHWTLYKRMLKSVHHNPSKFGFTEETLRPYEQLIMKLEMCLMEGNIFNNCVDGMFDDLRNGINVSKNTVLADEMMHIIKLLLNFVEPVIGEMTETDQRQRFIGLIALYVLYCKLYQSSDKKLFKQFWDSYKKLPGIHLTGNILWFPCEFLAAKLPPLLNTLDRKSRAILPTARSQWLVAKVANFSREVQVLTARASCWMIQMESSFRKGKTVLENLDMKCHLFRQGLVIARSLNYAVSTTMNMHMYEDKPMTKTLVLQLCKLIELIKAVEMTYHRRSMMVAQSVNHIVQRLSFSALTTLGTAKKRIISDKRYSDRRLDVLSAFVLAETALNGTGNKERLLIINLALSMATSMRSFKDDELVEFSGILKRLHDVVMLQQSLREACDTSFLYWHRVIFSTYIANLYENAIDVYKVKYMLAALQDCCLPLLAVKHLEDHEELVEQFNKEITADFQQHLVEPLCRDIETDLRLDIHHHEYQLDTRNPFKVGLKDLTVFLRVKPVKFFGRYLDIKSQVEHYLDTTFYNLTTVALHDWKKYSEMRHVATQKYGLHLMESHLPSQTLEQGLDVLEIMRNIQVFVSKYNYNLNNQIFVERSSNNKHLNTINIRHVANSIRTHGTGIMNTTVNFTFQFLKQKFYIFSQFLFDEHIKSRLIKDLRYFRENHADTDQRYPYDRAEKFNKGIRKLGVSADGQSYLDRFRLLITQIGNAMGYIRMIRSGGLHCCSSAVRYVPDLDDIISFEESCAEAGLPDETKTTARTLDRVVESMVKSFSGGTDYFKMLVNVFAPEFRDKRHIHLKNFYIIVPPLTVNFVESMISSKEKMTKKNKQGAAFTDDGFAMGVAYILKLLDQYHEFDSLHWFQSVLAQYKAEKEKVAKQAARGSGDEKLSQTMSLTVKRLDAYQQEFNLLYYSLSSARIFFRADKTSDEEKEESKPAADAQESSSAASSQPAVSTPAAGAFGPAVDDRSSSVPTSVAPPPPPPPPGGIPPPPPPPPLPPM